MKHMHAMMQYSAYRTISQSSKISLEIICLSSHPRAESTLRDESLWLVDGVSSRVDVDNRDIEVLGDGQEQTAILHHNAWISA